MLLGAELYRRYREYSEANGNKYPVGRNKFGALLAESGVGNGRAHTRKAERAYTGIALRPADTADTSLQETSPSKSSLRDYLEKNLSACQNIHKHRAFMDILPCANCGSDTLFRRHANGEPLCAYCTPDVSLVDVFEIVYAVGGPLWLEEERESGK